MAKPSLPTCEVCGLVLRDPESIERGTGPDCAAKRAGFYGDAGIDLAEVDELAALNLPDVQRWLRSMRLAIRDNKPGLAQSFLNQARKASTGYQTVWQIAA